MRRILIATTLLAAACGKKTIPATPEIKASVNQARLGIGSAGTNTQATIALQSLGSSVAGAVSSGTVASLDLSTGLSDPATLAAAAMLPPPSGLSRDLRIAGPGASTVTAAVVGCLKNGSGGIPKLDGAGQPGCAASDHLEVTYDDGDRLNITWSEASIAFDLTVAVVAGPWIGTNLRYSGSAGPSGASVTVRGALKYSKAGDPARIDADFNLAYTVTGSESAAGASIGISVNGTTTDRVGLLRASERWSLSMQTSAGAQGETLTMDWNGGVGIDLLKPDGSTRDHTVVFNVNLHALSQSNGAAIDVIWTAAGDVDYDGSGVGSLVIRSNQLNIRWTDGVEEGFDPAVLFGSFAV